LAREKLGALGQTRIGAMAARTGAGQRLKRYLEPSAPPAPPAEEPLGPPPPIRSVDRDHLTEVDRYWTGHTVNSTPFKTRAESAEYLEWRFDEYPLFREFSRLYGEHDDEVILDYGCGPGNDLTGFGLHTNAKRIIGVDVSPTALKLAQQRLALHGLDPARYDLILKSDATPELPIEDDSVDFVQSQGVLMSTSDPLGILREFRRVLKPGCRAQVMIYNENSVWFHLCTAYERMITIGDLAGLSVRDAFQRNTDGIDCPVSRCYTPEAFAELCGEAGLETEFVGGYLSQHELTSMKNSWAAAIADPRLPMEHREFLRSLTYDPAGMPMYNGFHAGIGGVYWLSER
jgi:SAM-dependent methyltransferase